jgi:hypothetical protein
MGERGTSSQVSVAFESHRRLEVERKKREILLGGEGRSEKYRPESLLRGPCSPFIKQGE